MQCPQGEIMLGFPEIGCTITNEVIMCLEQKGSLFEESRHHIAPGRYVCGIEELFEWCDRYDVGDGWLWTCSEPIEDLLAQTLQTPHQPYPKKEICAENSP